MYRKSVLTVTPSFLLLRQNPNPASFVYLDETAVTHIFLELIFKKNFKFSNMKIASFVTNLFLIL